MRKEYRKVLSIFLIATMLLGTFGEIQAAHLYGSRQNSQLDGIGGNLTLMSPGQADLLEKMRLRQELEAQYAGQSLPEETGEDYKLDVGPEQDVDIPMTYTSPTMPVIGHDDFEAIDVANSGEEFRSFTGAPDGIEPGAGNDSVGEGVSGPEFGQDFPDHQKNGDSEAESSEPEENDGNSNSDGNTGDANPPSGDGNVGGGLEDGGKEPDEGDESDSEKGSEEDPGTGQDGSDDEQGTDGGESPELPEEPEEPSEEPEEIMEDELLLQQEEILIAGQGTAASPFLIEDEEQFLHLFHSGMDVYQGVSILTAHYALQDDVNLSQADGFIGIGSLAAPFSGSFDGNGCEITLNISSTAENYVGLFRSLSGATVQNVTITGSVRGVNYVGGIAGYTADSTIQNSANLATINATRYLGGIVGSVVRSELSDNRNEGSLTSTSNPSTMGGIVGYASASSLIENSNEGTITGRQAVGGIAGQITGTTIIGCHNTGAVRSNENYSYVGGIAGYVENGSRIEECRSEGSVQGNQYTGGIAGSLYHAGTKITDSSVWGTVTGTGYVGGIAGYLDTSTAASGNRTYADVTGGGTTGGLAGYLGNQTTFSDSIVYGKVTGSGSVGGLAGYTGTNVRIDRSYYEGEKVSGTSNVGILVGYIGNNSLVVENSGYYITGEVDPEDAQIYFNDAHYDETLIERDGNAFRIFIPVRKENNAAIENNTPESISLNKRGYKVEKIYLSVNNQKLNYTLALESIQLESSDIEESIAGEGTEASPFLITNEEQFLFIASLASGTLKGVPALSAYYRLEADLDLSTSASFLGMGSRTQPFEGNFDGDGHTVNLNISSTVENYVGLFRAVIGGVVRDVTVTGGVKGVNYVGGVAGYTADSTIQNSTNYATVNATRYLGGIVGYAARTEMSGNRNAGSLTSTSNPSTMGGIVGYASASSLIENSNEGTITGRQAVGGIAGQITGTTIIGCHNTGAVRSNENYSYVGGIAGYVENGSRIEECRSEGSVQGNQYTGGIAGSLYHAGTKITDSSVWGTVTGTGYVGGIAGYLDTSTAASGNRTYADVTGGGTTGGLAGYLGNQTTFSDSIVYGKVTGSGSVGGLAGYTGTNVRIDRSYYEGEKVSGTSNVGILVGYIGNNSLVVENSGYYITGEVDPEDAEIYFNDALYDETLIERDGNAFRIFIPVRKENNAAIKNNTPESVSLNKRGYKVEKIYLSVNNQKLNYTLALESIQLESSDIEESIAGEGTEASPFLITNEEQFLFIASLASGTLKGVPALSAYYRLEADLDLSTSASFLGMGSRTQPFEGNFDGDGHTVNLNISSTVENYVGLFRAVIGGVVRDVTVTGGVKGVNYVGGVAGYTADSTIQNSTNYATVNATRYLGGIVGYAARTEMSGNRNAGSLTSTSNPSTMGGIVGYASASSLIENSNEGTITGRQAVGGIAGQITGTTIIGCHNTGAVRSNENYSYVGGIAGYVENVSRIEECRSEGSVQGNQYTGGIAGSLYHAGTKITDSSVWGTVTGTGYVGGIAGYLDTSTAASGNHTYADVTGGGTTGGLAGYLGNQTTFSDSIVYGKVTGSGSVGGLAGYTGTNVRIDRSYYEGEKVSGTGNVGILVGYIGNNSLVVENSGYYITGEVDPEDAQIYFNDAHYDETLIERDGNAFRMFIPVRKENNAAIENNTPESVSLNKRGYKVEKIYLSANNQKLNYTLALESIQLESSDIEESIAGDGTEASPFLITNEEQFLFIASLASGTLKGVPALSAYYRLEADLDLSTSASFLGMGSRTQPFEGNFDGGGHTVNLNISSTVENYVGLFRAVIGGVVRDVTVTGGVKGVNYVGGVAGYTADSTIQNSTNYATVNATRYLGGIVGYAARTEMSGNRNAGSLTSTSNPSTMGGIVGYASASSLVENNNEGAVTGRQAVGGIAGQVSETTIIGCHNMGAVRSNENYSYVGGIVGYAENGSRIETCRNESSVQGVHYTGGIAGILYHAGTKVTDSSVWGSVTGTGNVGGLVGLMEISTAASGNRVYADVSGNGTVGGLVGYMNSQTTLRDSNAYGNVTGGGNVGGLVGYTTSNTKVDRSYFEGEKVSGTSNVGILVGYIGNNSLVVENSGYYITGEVDPEDAQIYFNDALYDETLIERDGNAFRIFIPVRKENNAAIENNTPESVSLNKRGYKVEKIYLSVNNQKLNYTLALESIQLESSDIEESIAGEGTEASPFLITNEEQFLFIASLASGTLKGVPALSAYYRLEADLDLSTSASFLGMGSRTQPFEGNFDGGGHTVNLNISSTVENYVGLFRAVIGGVVRDVTVTGGVKGVNYVGGVAGYTADSTIQNSTNYATVNATRYLGGIVGYAARTEMSGNRNAGSLTSTSNPSTMGGIVGYASASSLVENNNEGAVTGRQAVGGIAGQVSETTIIGCHNMGAVRSNENYSYVGGIVGYAENGSRIETCRNESSVQGVHYTGGIAGILYHAGTKVTDSSVWGSVTGTGNVGGLVGLMEISTAASGNRVYADVSGNGTVGGLVGYMNSQTTLRDSNAYGNVTGGGNVGGLVGYTTSNTKVDRSYFEGEKVSGTSNVGILVGYIGNNSLVVENSGYYITGEVEPEDAQIYFNDAHYDETLIERDGREFRIFIPVSKVSGGTIQNNTPESVSFAKKGYDVEKVYLSANNQKLNYTLALGEIRLEGSNVEEGIAGEGTEASPFLIENEEQLLYVASLLNGNLKGVPALTAHYRLEARLNLSNYGYLGIGNQRYPFQGSFDGNGYQITLAINSSVENYVGLFRYVNGASIRNVTVAGRVTGNNYVGGIAGSAENAEIINVTNNTTISGKLYLGGIVGNLVNSTMLNSENLAAIRGEQYVGGLTGRISDGEIADSSNKGVITASASTAYSGGIAGQALNATFRNTQIRDVNLSSSGAKINVFYGTGSNNEFYESGIILTAETSVENPEITITGFEDISAAEMITINYVGRRFTMFIPVNQTKNNTVTDAGLRISKAMYYDRQFTLKTSSTGYNLVLPDYISLVPKSNVNLDVISVESPANAVIDTVLKLVRAAVSEDVEIIYVDLETSENTSWKLYYDFGCTNEVEDNLLPLEPGDNTVYIEIVGDDGVSRQIYTLYISREHKKPTMVTGLTAIPGTFEVQLRWDMAYEASVQGYYLYRSVSPGSGYSRIATVTNRNTLSYVDRNVTADRQYYYKISAYNDLGIESQLSDYVSVIVSSDTQPPVVLGISPIDETVIGKYTSITVRMQDNVGLKDVELFYAVEEDNWISIGKKNVTGITASAVFQLGEIDHHGRIFVRAIATDQSGHVGDGTPVRIYNLDTEGPEKVIGLNGTTTANGVTLRWQDVPDYDFSYFSVEQKMEGETEYRKIATVSTTLGYQVTGLLPETNYWYRVRAFDRFDNPGEYSDELHVFTDTDTARPQVTSIRPLPGFYAANIPITVTATDNTAVTLVELEYSLDKSEWELVESRIIASPVKSVTVSFDLDLNELPEGPVFVRAFAEDKAGNRSYSSSVVEHRIDRTPPAKPVGLSVSSTAEYILVQWEKGTEADLKSYSVYRADSLEGSYSRVTSGLTALGYVDRNVVYGTTYYYKVTATDAAGNISEYSDAVWGTTTEDTTPPWIYSVNPQNGSPIGIKPSIRVQARDNLNLAGIHGQYLDGSRWVDLWSTSASGNNFTHTFRWENEELPGGEQTMRFWAVDAAGNLSDYYEVTYDLKNYQIDAPEVIVTPLDMSLQISWREVSYSDIAGYRLYREDSDKDTLLASIQKGGTYSYTDHRLTPGKTYSYFVEVFDTYGNISISDVVSGEPLSGDPYPPEANAGFDFNTMVGVEVAFNGDLSTDNVGITAYHWDFGDGNTGSGAKPVHVYREDGTYTVTLTVYDAAGNQDSHSIQVKVFAPSQAGTLIITVIDQDTGVPLADASVYIDIPEEPILCRTDNNGQTILVAEPGTYSISAYKTGYLPKEYHEKVEQYVESRATLGIPQGDIVVGEIWTRRLSLQEIVELGIDIDDPDNHHVYNFDVTLTFQEMELDYNFKLDSNGNFYVPGGSGGGGSTGGWSSGGGTIGLPNGGTGHVHSVPSENKEVPPSIVILSVSNSASYLKEFYSVNLVMQNMADPQFVLTDNAFRLNLPDGLSLAKTAQTQDLIIETGDIAGGDFVNVSWIVRGDTAGAYELSVNYEGTLMPFRELVEAVFKTNEDLVVEPGSGLKIYVNPERIGVAGHEYQMRYAVKNESEFPAYLVKMKFGTNLEVEPYILRMIDDDGSIVEALVSEMEYFIPDVSKQGGLPEMSSGDSLEIGILGPGEVLYATHAVRFPDDEPGLFYRLIDAVYETIGGSTTEIPVEFVDQLPLPGAGWVPPVWYNNTTKVDAFGHKELNVTVMNVTGINDIPFTLRHYSGAAVLEDDVFNQHPDEGSWDFGNAGWSSIYEMQIKPQEDGSVNLYAAPGLALRFAGENARKRLVSGVPEGSAFEITGVAVTNEYYCNEIGYQNYRLVKDDSGTFVLIDPSENYYYFGSDGKMNRTFNRRGQSIQIQRSEQAMFITEAGTDKRITATYGPNGYITSLVDNLGRQALIRYSNVDGKVAISEITNFLSDKVTYEYEGHRIVRESINSTDVYTYEYDEYGRVLSQTDGEGKVFTYSYDDESEIWRTIITTTDRDGREEVTVVNHAGMILSQKDGLGNTSYYTYDGNKNLTSARDANGNTMTYDYNDRGKLLSVTDPEGVTISMTYDENGNMLTQTTRTGATSTYAYTDQNWLERAVDDRGVVTEYVYDENGQAIAKTVSGLGTATYTYEQGRQVSATDFLGNTSKSEYDEAGRRVSSTDREGNTVRYTYDDMNRIIKYTDPRGNSGDYTYDERGNLLTATDPRGNTTTYAYDNNNRLIKETNALGEVTEYRYDGEGHITSVLYPDGSTTSYVYDKASRRIEAIDAEENKTAFVYDPAGQLVQQILANGGEMHYQYDRSGRLTKQTDPTEGAVSYAYDSIGQLARVTDAVGNSLWYTYDQSGYLLTVTNSENHSMSFDYDEYGRTIAETDANGNESTYQYDAGHRLVKATNALGFETQYQYNGNGQVVKTIDAKGAETHVTYDEAGNVTAVTNALGNTFQAEYDTIGNVTAVKDAYGVTIQTITYDALNRPVEVADALNYTRKSEYDSMYRVIAGITALNETTAYTYDNMGRLLTYTEPEGGVTSFTYDEMGNVASMTDAIGGISTYTYDLSGRLIEEERAAGGTKSYRYNENGLLTGLVNGRGQELSFGYDRANRLAHGAGRSYTYDGNGNVLTVTNEEGTITRTYDALNRVTTYTDVYGNTIGYEYDEVSNLVAIRYPDGKEVTYDYDLLGQMETVTDYEGRTTGYAYDKNGRLLKTTYANGITEEHTYNANGQVVSSMTKKGSTLITGRIYTYDGNGNIIDEEDDIKQVRASYDKNGQLIGETDIWNSGRKDTLTYQYDAAGNMLTEKIVGRGSGATSNQTDLRYQGGNQMVTWNGQEVRFDLDGNMTWGPLGGIFANYQYDSLNQLTQAGDTKYAYDGEGRRIQTTVNGQTTRYITDPNSGLSKLLMKQDPDGTVTYYVYGKGLISQETVKSGGSSEYRFFHYDYRGSTVAMTDQYGTVTDRITYDPYGKVTSRTGATETIFLYVGQWGVQTDDNGLLYMRARYYSVELNRFINEDPIRDGLNWYAYAGNNPLGYVDPRGMRPSGGNSSSYMDKMAELVADAPKLDPELTQRLQEIKEEYLPDNSFLLYGRAELQVKNSNTKALKDVVGSENGEVKTNNIEFKANAFTSLDNLLEFGWYDDYTSFSYANIRGPHMENGLTLLDAEAGMIKTDYVNNEKWQVTQSVLTADAKVGIGTDYIGAAAGARLLGLQAIRKLQVQDYMRPGEEIILGGEFEFLSIGGKVIIDPESGTIKLGASYLVGASIIVGYKFDIENRVIPKEDDPRTKYR